MKRESNDKEVMRPEKAKRVQKVLNEPRRGSTVRVKTTKNQIAR